MPNNIFKVSYSSRHRDKKHVLSSYCFQLRLTYNVRQTLQEQGHFIYYFKTSLRRPDFNVVCYHQRSDVV